MDQKYCCVFVSGDLGRSPRM